MSELERDAEILSEILAGIDPSTSPGNRRAIAERRFFKVLEQEVPAKSDLGVAGSLDTVAPQTHDGGMTNSLTTKKTSAAAVSRALARGGFRPLASGMRGRREGINVSGNSTGVWVSVDFDSESAASRRANELVEVLAQDYEIRRVSPTILCVTGRSA